MNTSRKTALTMGVLFSIGTVAGILSVLVSQPIFGASDYLSQIAGNQNELILEALLVLIMGLALALVTIVFYPVAKRYSETLAIGYVVFRGAIETVIYIALVISWLVLIPLSQEYVGAGAADATMLQTLGELVQATGDALSQASS